MSKPTFLSVLTILSSLAWGSGMASAEEKAPPPSAETRIKAFSIDFNWGPGGVNRFSGPGMFAQADPRKHLEWYQDMGVNTIQTFCVSCNGYAWYQDSAVAPPQPGLKHDFLNEITKLGHANGMKVMGYFCIAANTRWGQKHPELSYSDIGKPGVPPAWKHVPLTDEYIAYLDAQIRDVLTKTDIDGFMVDWLRQPDDKFRKEGWLECEKKLYHKLTGRKFPIEGAPTQKDVAEYDSLAIERCWQTIRKAAKSTKPDCIIWLSSPNLKDPVVGATSLISQVDWLMNEDPEPDTLMAVREAAGPHARILQCLCGWGDSHDPAKVVGDSRMDDVGFFGFAKPDATTTLPLTVDQAKSDQDKGNAVNIGKLRKLYR
jgi:uncharacterized lipoprotein YddW (UPF0748 family)